MELLSAMQHAAKRLSAQGLDAYEVAGFSDLWLSISVKKQMVDSFQRSESRGIAIRAAGDSRMGFAQTTDIGIKAVDRAIEQALDAMRLVDPSDEAVVPPPQKPVADFVEPAGRPLWDIPDDEKIRLAIALESAAFAADNRIVRVKHPSYEESVREMAVVNSHGVSVRARRGLASVELKAVASEGAGQESAYEFSTAHRMEDLDAEAVGRRAAERAVERLGAAPIGAVKLPVVFEPRAAAAMVRLAAPSFFADNVQRGKSALAAKRGKASYHPSVTIVDDGLLPGGFGSFPFDGEGIPRRRTILAADGVIQGWLYDGARAARDKVESTGSCVREDLRRMPAIGVSNCFMKGGDRKPDDLRRAGGRVIVITDLLGLHTANTITGDFSLGAEGLLIENGVVVQPLRGMTVAGNVHEVMNHIAGIGDDLTFFRSYGAPTILVEELMLGG